MNAERTAQRLYTLQNLIFNLSAWHFDNGNENHYIPDILERYEKVVQKGQEAGIDGQTIRKFCSIQFPVRDPQLQNFMFLDEQNMENVSANLDRSRVNSKRSINVLQLNQAVTTDNTTANQDLGTYQIKTIDQPILDKVTGMITQRVMSFGQNVKLVIHKLNAKSMKILDKVTHIVRTKLGIGALNFQYIFTHLDSFFNIVGDALHTDDKYVLANVGEAVLQRALTNSMQTAPQTVKASNTATMPVYTPQDEFMSAFGYFPDRQM